MQSKNTPLFIEFDENFIKIKSNDASFYSIGYKNLKNGRRAFFTLENIDFDIIAKQKGWLEDKDCLCHDATYEQINEWLKWLASEELNIRAVLALEKAQRGFLQQGEELLELGEKYNRLLSKHQRATEALSVLTKENIKLKVKYGSYPSNKQKVS
jgi:hypothetical protein